MKKQSILLGFSRYKDGPLAVKAMEIITRMTGNGYFVNPDPSLQAVQAKLDTYIAALAAMDGSTHNTLLKRQARKALEAILRLLGLFVQQHGNDDPVILESSGFDLTASTVVRHSEATMEAEGFSVKFVDPTGSVLLSCKKADGARGYLFQYALQSAPADWVYVFSTLPQYLLEGLELNKSYLFRVAPLCKSHRLAFTEVVTKYVN